MGGDQAPLLAPVRSRRRTERELEDQAKRPLQPDDEAASDPPTSEEDDVQFAVFEHFDPAIAQAEIEAEELEQQAYDIMSIAELGQLQEQAEQQPSVLPQPVQPTDEERAVHEMLHLGIPPWCERCVASKAKEDPHSLQSAEAKISDTPVIQLDYCFYSRLGERVEQESRLVTCMSAKSASSIKNESGLILQSRDGSIGPSIKSVAILAQGIFTQVVFFSDAQCTASVL